MMHRLLGFATLNHNLLQQPLQLVADRHRPKGTEPRPPRITQRHPEPRKQQLGDNPRQLPEHFAPIST